MSSRIQLYFYNLFSNIIDLINKYIYLSSRTQIPGVQKTIEIS
ncbi:MAG: hypothetical protein BAJALOKI1v1_2170007 [Promethearchaeota archaeon]|nr:MAG: hypothetical protein BAJALOKI1v1_2170007 [Candidatus Lokiarchaeota archaeon]